MADQDDVYEEEDEGQPPAAGNDLAKTALLAVAGLGVALIARKLLKPSSGAGATSAWGQFAQALRETQQEADGRGREEAAAARAKNAALAATAASEAARTMGNSMANIARNMGPDRRRD